MLFKNTMYKISYIKYSYWYWMFCLISALFFGNQDLLVNTKDFEKGDVCQVQEWKHKHHETKYFDDRYEGVVLRNTIQKLNAPKFESYKAKDFSYVKAKNVDLNSWINGKEYRTVIRKGFKQGRIFANHYRIAECGCGTGCSLVWIIDMMTGKITDHMTISNMTGSTFYVQPDSRLFISSSHLLYEETDCWRQEVEFYVLNDKGKLELIKTITQKEIEKVYPLGFSKFKFPSDLGYKIDKTKWTCEEKDKTTVCTSRDASHIL